MNPSIQHQHSLHFMHFPSFTTLPLFASWSRRYLRGRLRAGLRGRCCGGCRADRDRRGGRSRCPCRGRRPETCSRGWRCAARPRSRRPCRRRNSRACAMRRSVSLPTTNVAPGKSRDFSSNVAARERITGCSGRKLAQPAIDLEIIQRRLIDVQDRNLHRHRPLENFGGDSQHPPMPLMQRIEGPGKNRRSARESCRRSRRLRSCPRANPAKAAGPSVAVCSMCSPSSRSRVRSARHAARFGNGVQQEPADEPFFFRPAAAVFQQFDRPGGRQRGGLQGQMRPMRTAPRPIGGQSGRAGKAGQLIVGLMELPRPQKGGHGQRPGGSVRAKLVGPSAEESDDRFGAIGNLGFQERPRSAGHFEQIGNRTASPAGDRQNDPGRSVVYLLNELIDAEIHNGGSSLPSLAILAKSGK